MLSVSQLNRLARSLLEDAFALIRVEGEISGYRPASSGHGYFTLKDSGAELRCVMYRNRLLLTKLKPAAAGRVIARGRITLYEARGEYQFLVESLEEAGLGAQMVALQALREKLAAEGLFDSLRKRPLPRFPRRLAVLTSLHGAAIHDVLAVLKRRYRLLHITLVAIPVQGRTAELDIAQRLRDVARFTPAFDVILLTRGGGSVEDLWCFQAESVVRAIAASPIPVVSAIGHESDHTLADLAADLRAPTPSAAAEAIVPDGLAIRDQIDALLRRVVVRTERAIGEGGQSLDQRLRVLSAHSPRRELPLCQNRLGQASGRLDALCRRQVDVQTARLALALTRLQAQSPARRLQQMAERMALANRVLRRAWQATWRSQSATLANLESRLPSPRAVGDKVQSAALHWGRAERALQACVLRDADRRRKALDYLRRQLDALDPKQVLQRGYALVLDANTGQPLITKQAAAAQQKLLIEFADGTLPVSPTHS